MQQHEDMSVALTANNSSGNQTLYLSKVKQDGYEESYVFQLVGQYDGKEIQIDFDDTTEEELLDIKCMIDLMLEVKFK